VLWDENNKVLVLLSDMSAYKVNILQVDITALK